MLGEKHPDTLASMHNLTETYQGLGRLKEAVSLGEGCSKSQKKVLGDEHPYTVDLMNDLAILYQTLGRFNEAINLVEACVEIRTRKLGEDPNTQCSMDLNQNIEQLPAYQKIQ